MWNSVDVDWGRRCAHSLQRGGDGKGRDSQPETDKVSQKEKTKIMFVSSSLEPQPQECWTLVADVSLTPSLMFGFCGLIQVTVLLFFDGKRTKTMYDKIFVRAQQRLFNMRCRKLYRQLAEPPLHWHMPFFTQNVSIAQVKKIKVAGTKCWLKLSALCDLLEIICTLGPEASGSSG